MAKKAAGGSKRKASAPKSAAGGVKRKSAAGGVKARKAPVAARAAPPDDDHPPWTPSKFALWSQRWSDPNDANPTSVLLHHPTAPFVRFVDDVDDDTMYNIGFCYLTNATENADIDPPLGITPRWLAALNPATGADPTFWWLPIRWPISDVDFDDPSSAADPLVSFRAGRELPDGTQVDQTIILLASEWLSEKYLGSGFGIRIVAHVRPATGGRFEVRITGITATLPFGGYLTSGISTKSIFPLSLSLVLTNKAAIIAEMATTLGLENASVQIQGIRLAKVGDGPIQVEWRCTGKSKTIGGRTNPIPYSFVFFGTPDQAGTLVSKAELVADASTPGFARVFPRDPESQVDPTSAKSKIHKRRPTRYKKGFDPRLGEDLDRFREEQQITTNRKDPLIYPLLNPLPPHRPEEEVVVCSGFVLDDRGAISGALKEVDLPDTGPDSPYIWSNDFAAISAFQNVKGFFQRLRAYGLPPYQYFRIAKLPLKLHYRSGVRPGPGKDGQTVNARVLPEGFPVGFEGPTPPSARPALEMHFAMATLATRARKPWNGKDRSPAEPLGIAADERWVWHEIGHVLLMASVGELQFRFAHSPGDALAAIVADPRSILGTDANWRGATFPWVFLPRRHDRCVTCGWSWGGTLHYAMSQVPDSVGPRRKGYRTEQILSSSLFRLYRCIGGDTRQVGLPDPDIYARDSASHYSVYLIMRAIQILGTGGVVLANKPEQFVTALIDADIHTASSTPSWHVVFPPPGSTNPSDTFDRVGGCVQKVIRWAFEAQGLYRNFNNAPGYPPPVDIYIESLRPTVDSANGIDYGRGSYYPVSLDWDSKQSGTSPAPAWQAAAGAIQVTGSNITVVVGNRGSQPAANVEVSIWWQSWPTSGPLPKWNTGVWTKCTPTLPNQTIPAGGSATFGPFTHTPPGTRYVVLAQATCGDDRANTDPATLLPCSQVETPLTDLVANDNNLGLRVIG
jgi:hypothetical protein